MYEKTLYIESYGFGVFKIRWCDVRREGVARLCEGKKKTTYAHTMSEWGGGHHNHISLLNFWISLFVKIYDVSLLMLMSLINVVKRDLDLWGSNWDQTRLVKLVHVDFSFWTQKFQRFYIITLKESTCTGRKYINSQATLAI